MKKEKDASCENNYNDDSDISFKKIIGIFDFVEKDLMRKNLEDGFFFIKEFLNKNMLKFRKEIYNNEKNIDNDNRKRTNKYVIETILKAYEYITFNLFRNQRFK